MAEGFPIIATQSDTITSPANLFATNITFSDVPANFAQEIQVSLWLGASSVISIVFNGTNYVINNGTAVQGSVVFTVLVGNNDTFNITTDGSSIPIVATIAGG